MLTHIPCAGQWHWRGSHFGLDRANAISSKKGVAAIRLYHKVQTRATAKRPSAWIESLMIVVDYSTIFFRNLSRSPPNRLTVLIVAEEAPPDVDGIHAEVCVYLSFTLAPALQSIHCN